MDSKKLFLNKSFHIQAHRGVQSLFPENTLAAFEKAIEIGADCIELDLVFTKDLEIIIFHDQEIEGRKIVDLTLQEIKAFDVGHRNPNFPMQEEILGEKIPTLKELFALVKSSNLKNSKKIIFNLELKSHEKTENSQKDLLTFVTKILNIVSEFSFENRVYFSSFDKSLLKIIRKIDPTAILAYLYYAKDFNDLDSYIQECENMLVQIASPCVNLITQDVVKKLQKHSLKVVVWTVNNEEIAKTLKGWGVNGIISDYPQKFL